MGFRGEDLKLRFVEPAGLNPIVGFHSRFRWFFLRRPCGPFILSAEEENSRIIFIYFQGRGKTWGFAGDFALVVSLSSARLSGRQAVCKLPTDEIDR